MTNIQIDPNDPRATRLVWIDLEMTGLDPEKERIVEMAAIVTEADLTVVAESPVIAVHQPDELFDAMDEWNTKHHHASGLVERSKTSDIDEAQAEQMMLSFLSEHLPSGASPLCGNSVSQDRRFLWRAMPALNEFFTYRHIDVSTIKELCLRWQPDLAKGFVKENKHLALDDIRESIEELKYYRAQGFIGSEI